MSKVKMTLYFALRVAIALFVINLVIGVFARWIAADLAGQIQRVIFNPTSFLPSNQA